MKKLMLILLALAVVAMYAPNAICDEQVYVIEKGHSVKVDKNIVDWVGLPPLKDNTACVDKGEFIWRDAKKDDVGAGNYVYPLDKKLQKGADIREFRVTYDDKKIYFMIKCSRPNDWWVPYRIIGIDTDGAAGGKEGGVVLAQGDIDEFNTYNGTFAEMKVADELACDFVVAVASTYKGRLWDGKGELIAYVEGDDKPVPGFKVADASWYAMEISLPYDIIGDPRGKTWRFIVGVGLQDQDLSREVYEEADEWHAGGSDEPTLDEDGVDPDVFDLVGADNEGQIADLNSYNPNGAPGDTDSFATITNSYVAITFGE
ncbi:MAG: glucodextranase DOMON-like domain-containing protein [Candidatus Kappaea frigidicola]|nr:glucodextranase DOMON-like domain-containing protein [Candidatus Kappaea frigidicola]